MSRLSDLDGLAVKDPILYKLAFDAVTEWDRLTRGHLVPLPTIGYVAAEEESSSSDNVLLELSTWHVYAHLIRELEAHCNGVKKWIIMHDTTVDAEKGETLRAGWNPEEQAAQTGYPVSEITMGLWPAIEKFLGDHPEWVLEKRYTNCNGLTILRRV